MAATGEICTSLRREKDGATEQSGSLPERTTLFSGGQARLDHIHAFRALLVLGLVLNEQPACSKICTDW